MGDISVAHNWVCKNETLSIVSKLQYLNNEVRKPKPDIKLKLSQMPSKWAMSHTVVARAGVCVCVHMCKEFFLRIQVSIFGVTQYCWNFGWKMCLCSF